MQKDFGINITPRRRTSVKANEEEKDDEEVSALSQKGAGSVKDI